MITPLQYPGWRGIGPKRFLLPALLIFAVAGSGWLLWGCSQDGGDAAGTGKAARPVPVEVAPIEEGPIALQRTFSGALEAQAEFVVAPKVSGRVKHVTVNIADTVDLGQIVAELDDDEYVQAVAQAQADLAVARANLSEAESALEIARREFNRTESLVQRGIASDSEFDVAQQDRWPSRPSWKLLRPNWPGPRHPLKPSE
jgi:multidrug efflux pump subunit AcrA (membrane-fusion protein)